MKYVTLGKTGLKVSKNSILLLPVGKRHLRHTVVCKGRHQALVQDEASCIPSTSPKAGRLNR